MASEQMIDGRARRALWISLAAIYGRAWLDVFGDSEGTAARAWARGLAGLTEEQVAEGIMACTVSADPTPPTLPEFRARCLGVLSFPDVRHELRGESQRSLFTHTVWQLLDRDAYAKARGRTARRLLREAYDLARARAMRGVHQAPTPPPVLALVRESRSTSWHPPSPDRRERVVQEARAAAGIESDQGAGSIHG